MTGDFLDISSTSHLYIHTFVDLIAGLEREYSVCIMSPPYKETEDYYRTELFWQVTNIVLDSLNRENKDFPYKELNELKGVWSILNIILF